MAKMVLINPDEQLKSIIKIATLVVEGVEEGHITKEQIPLFITKLWEKVSKEHG